MRNIFVFFYIFLFCVPFSRVGWSAENAEKSPKASTTSPYAHSNKSPNQSPPTTYPLFRPHASKYYPPKETRRAVLFSAMLPGSGQVYAGSPTKGFAFLVVEFGVLAVAGLNLDRAAHYDDNAERFTTGFYDSYTETFLTVDQGHVKARSHAKLGGILLAAGIGIHIWNVFDAAETVKRYNNQRFPAQVQQTESGEPYLTFTYHF
jgi:hypothetical protein